MWTSRDVIPLRYAYSIYSVLAGEPLNLMEWWELKKKHEEKQQQAKPKKE